MKKTIAVSDRVFQELKRLKEELGVPSYDMVLRYLLRLPPFYRGRGGDNLSRAIKYRDRILESQGYITYEQLVEVARKFNVSVSNLMEDLIMGEDGNYRKIEGGLG